MTAEPQKPKLCIDLSKAYDNDDTITFKLLHKKCQSFGNFWLLKWLLDKMYLSIWSLIICLYEGEKSQLQPTSYWLPSNRVRNRMEDWVTAGITCACNGAEVSKFQQHDRQEVFFWHIHWNFTNDSLQRQNTSVLWLWCAPWYK